jgi:DNA mismatch repair protein MutL
LIFFINQRPIEHRSLAHAVLEAYRPYITDGRFPSCLIFLTIPAEWVDVNVHPAKREVRLRDEHAVHDLVMRAVREGLGTLIGKGQPPAGSGFETMPALGSHAYTGNLNSGWSGQRVKESVANYFRSTQPAFAERLPLGFSQPRTMPGDNQETLPVASVRSWPEPILGQAGRTYLAGSDERGFFLIDQHAAHERILYERFRAQGGAVERQALLLPITLELTASRGALLQGQLDAFTDLGFEISGFGKNTFVVRTQPQAWSGGDLAGWVNEMLDHLAENAQKPGTELFKEHALHSLACHAAVKAGDRLQPEVARLIWEGIQTLEPPLTCPHGRPLILRWDWSELDRLFKRT